jgi:hypothetical protein
MRPHIGRRAGVFVVRLLRSKEQMALPTRADATRFDPEDPKTRGRRRLSRSRAEQHAPPAMDGARAVGWSS